MQRLGNGGKRSTESYRRPHGQSSNGSSIIRKDGALVSLLPTATATHDGDGVRTTRGTSGLLRVLAVPGDDVSTQSSKYERYVPTTLRSLHARMAASSAHERGITNVNRSTKFLIISILNRVIVFRFELGFLLFSVTNLTEVLPKKKRNLLLADIFFPKKLFSVILKRPLIFGNG